MGNGKRINISDDTGHSNNADVHHPGNKVLKPGTATKDKSRLGRRLSWEEVSGMTGQMVWYEIPLQPGPVWRVVIPEKHMPGYRRYYVKGESYMSDRLMLYAGADARTIADEYWCRNRFYALKGGDAE